MPTLWSRTAAAQSTPDSLRLHASLGFSDTVRLGRWAPLTVTLENTGNLITGRLEVLVRSGDELAGTDFSTVFERDLELVRGARKRFSFTVYIDSVSEPVDIRVVSNEQIVARQSIDLRNRFTDARLIAVLSRNASLDFLNDSAGNGVRVTYPHPGMLPQQWQGYDGVAAMIVHGVTLEQWSPAQFVALKKWLSQGGKLFVAGGPDYASLRTERLAELLPARPDGLVTVDNAEPFHKVLGGSFSAPRPFQIHRTSENVGRVNLAAGQYPLVIDQAYGAGRVAYLTFDIGAYPFAGWSDSARFWRRQLDLEPDAAVSALRDISRSVIPSLFRNASPSFAHRLVVGSFLVAYLVLLAVMFNQRNQPAGFAGRSPGMRRWPLWLAPVFFTPFAYLLFVTLLSPARVHANVVTLINASQHKASQGSAYATLDFELGLYSNRAELATVSLASSSSVFLPVVDRQRPDQVSNWIQRDGVPQRLRVADPRPFVLHTLSGSDVIPFRLDASVNQTEAGVEVDVHSQVSRTLAFSWLVFDGWLYPLGPVVAGQQHRFTVLKKAVVSTGDQNAISARLHRIPERKRSAVVTALLHMIARQRRDNPLSGDEALLVAVPETTQPVIMVDSVLQSKQVDLVMSRLSVNLLHREGVEQGEGYRDVR